MINYSTNVIRKASILFLSLVVVATGFAQSKKEKNIADASEAKVEFIKTDAKMADLFGKAYGYVIFPNVGKGALGVGGAAGNGVAYEQGAIAGAAKMTQVTIGFQAGGQAYREVIFFESKADMDRFKENKFEFFT